MNLLLFLLVFCMALDSVTASIALHMVSRGNVVDPLALAFGVQREAIMCRESMVGLVCSGRAGKTRGFLLKWLEVKERKPGQISVYVALTRQSAERIAWTQLKLMNKEYGLGLKFTEDDLTAVDASGSQLVILGANRDDLIDVLRGFPIVLIGFDEAAFFRSGLLKRAFEDAVLVRLMDYDGECWIMSTPGYVLAGYHYEIVTGKVKGFRIFSWTFFDNPHLPAARPDLTDEQKRAYRVEWARKTRERRGWTEKTASYVRDFLGKYADDPDARVYKFTRELHCVQQMPKSWHENRSRWTKVLGADYGSTNAFALVLWAFEEGSPDCYMVKAQKWYGKTPSQTADLTQEWVTEFAPDVIVGDAAAKGYIDEARERHQLPIENADKLHKLAHIRWMNDAYTFVATEKVDGVKVERPAPRIRIVEPDCEDYCSEAEKLGKDPRYDQHHVKHGAEDPNAENDACDAALYGWTRCYAWLGGIPPENDNDDDGEAFDDEGDDHEGEFEYGHERRQRRARG